MDAGALQIPFAYEEFLGKYPGLRRILGFGLLAVSDTPWQRFERNSWCTMVRNKDYIHSIMITEL